MRIRVTSVNWTLLGLEWQPAQYVVSYTGDIVSQVKFSDAKRHASLLSSFLLEKPLYFGVNEISSFQKLVGNLDR